jgi:undecaprenyl-diphosphatase
VTASHPLDSKLGERARLSFGALIRHEDFRLYFALFVVLVLLLAFLSLANLVRGPGAIELDASLLRALREPAGDPIGPRWFEDMWRDITALGSGVVLTLVTSTVVLFLVLEGHRRAAFVALVLVLAGWQLSNGLKVLIDRPRPDIVEHFAYVTSKSFPSGHSMMAAVIYPTLGALIARTLRARVAKLYVMGVALTLTALIGVSRVYLGVHYPSDVLGGWCVGLGWALLCWVLMRRLQRRGAA